MINEQVVKEAMDNMSPEELQDAEEMAAMIKREEEVLIEIITKDTKHHPVDYVIARIAAMANLLRATTGKGITLDIYAERIIGETTNMVSGMKKVHGL